MGALPFLALQLVALALVFLMGYFAGGNGDPGDDTVRAAGSTSPGAGDLSLGRPPGRPDGTELSPVGPPRADPDAPTALERAFLSESHVFTVSVFAADKTEYGRQQMRAVRDHLLEKGYAAVIPPESPYAHRAVLCVGGAARQSDLLGLRDELRLLPGLYGRGRLCQDAWVDNIENYR